MKLYLVRHGETYENLQRISQGHFNSQLTEDGISQAKAIAKRLSKEKMDYAYSSDLDRAVRTAKEILVFHPNLKLQTTADLREQAKGIYEGQPREKLYGELEKRGLNWYEFTPEGGEHLQNVWDKVVGFYRELLSKHKNDSVLIVSHGGPISCLIAYLHKKQLSEFRQFIPKNTAISIIKVNEKGNAEFEAINCSNHLSE